MRKLKKPTDLPKDVLLTCISNYQSKELKKRLTSYTEEITKASKIYEEKVKDTSLHTILVQEEEEGIVRKSEMIKVYDDKFSKKGQPGRTYYDKLKAAPRLKKCPLCGYRIVSTLDHHLPKTKYPIFAVTPVNLIPACFDCNKIKEAANPKSAEEETLHPYFDDIETELWLEADVIVGNPIGFRFFVGKPTNWDEIKIKRVKHHFEFFDLGELYSSYAAEEISLRQYSLVNIYEKAGAKGVRAQLLDFKNSSERVYLNSWQTAMYRALANSDWICCEGLNQELLYM